MSELERQPWTTWAAIVMAAAAIVALFLSHLQNKETVSVAQATLNEAIKNRDAQQAQFNAERQGWRKTLVEQQRQFAAQQLQWDAERQERARLMEAERAPHLTQFQCCNPIAMEPVETLFGSQIQIPEEIQPAPDSLIRGYVLQIINLGPGTAKATKVTWHVDTIYNIDGSSHVAPPFSDSTNHTRPFHLRADQEGKVYHLPSCIVEDVSSEIARIEGYVEFACTDIAGKPYQFRYGFWMAPQYQQLPGRPAQSFLHLHIDEQTTDYITPAPAPDEAPVPTYAPDPVPAPAL